MPGQTMGLARPVVDEETVLYRKVTWRLMPILFALTMPRRLVNR